MVNNNDQFFKFFKKETEKFLECNAVEFLCKLIDETVCCQSSKNTISFFSCVLIFYMGVTTNLEPSIGEIRCYWEDAFIQKEDRISIVNIGLNSFPEVFLKSS